MVVGATTTEPVITIRPSMKILVELIVIMYLCQFVVKIGSDMPPLDRHRIMPAAG